jgi:glycosyltransferase involved in cell wall biosynthesis
VRVLLVSHGYPPHGVAGVERVAEQTARSLAARGHDVTVLTRRTPVAPPTIALEHEHRDGVDIVWGAGGGITVGLYPTHETQMEHVLQRTLAERTPDVVILSHVLNHSARYAHVAHRWGIPVLLELHDFFAACPLAHLQRISGERCLGPDGGAACAAACFHDQDDAHARWALRALEHQALVREADVVLAPSRFVADYFAGMRGAGPPIRVVGNGIGVVPPAVRPVRDEDDPGAPVLTLASIGVVVEHKAPDVVVEALRLARLGRVRYVLCGAVVEDYGDELRELADEVPGLELRMIGRFDPEQLPMLLADADAVVVPSVVWETYSIAAREAMACGVPVIASRLGALPEAIRDGENGLLFEPGDAEELAGILAGLAADRSRLRALADGIRPDDWISVDERTDAVEAILRELVAAGRPALEGPPDELAAVRGVFPDPGSRARPRRRVRWRERLDVDDGAGDDEDRSPTDRA